MILLAIGLVAATAAEPDLAAAATLQVARDECRGPVVDAEVRVCARSKVRNRYQVTDPNAPWDPRAQTSSVALERYRLIQEGQTGIGACSAVGPGGANGCMRERQLRNRKLIKRW